MAVIFFNLPCPHVFDPFSEFSAIIPKSQIIPSFPLQPPSPNSSHTKDVPLAILRLKFKVSNISLPAYFNPQRCYCTTFSLLIAAQRSFTPLLLSRPSGSAFGGQEVNYNVKLRRPPRAAALPHAIVRLKAGPAGRRMTATRLSALL